MKGSEQVAAICFRIDRQGIRFLLVRTGGGRWTFPKGSIESGLTHAQAAALEAFEEAGVHGRIEKASFVTYVHRKPKCDRRKKRKQSIVHAHLCEVLTLDEPKECHRKPAWFSTQKTKERLQQDRTNEQAQDLIRVVDLALVRIRALAGAKEGNHLWQHVSLEAPGNTNLGDAAPIKARRRSLPRPALLPADPALRATERRLLSGGSKCT